MKVLIDLPVSRGDVVLATASLRQYAEENPDDYVWFATHYSNESIVAGINNSIKNNFIKLLFYFDRQTIDAVKPRFDKYIDLKIYEEGNWYSVYNDCLINIYAKKMGLSELKYRPYIDINFVVVERVKKLRLPDEYIVVHTSSPHPSKNYSRFNELVKLLPKVLFVQVGTLADKMIVAPNVIDCRGVGTLKDVAHIIKNSKGFIGVDSVAGHICSCENIDKESITIFGATHVEFSRPRHDKSVVISPDSGVCAKMPCAAGVCFNDKKCIDTIDPKDIIKIIEQAEMI
jgi:hypothetical protein